MLEYLYIRHNLLLGGQLKTMDKISLNKLQINHTGTIDSLHCDGTIRRRFLDLGLINRYKNNTSFC